jgi:hypothetical protein
LQGLLLGRRRAAVSDGHPEGDPKEITVTPLARNNYLVELTEQNGQIQFAYLVGTKVVCIFEGVTKKGNE